MYAILDNVQNTVNDEEAHQYENRALLVNTVPQSESPVFDDEYLQLQNDNSPSLDQQTAEKEEDAPTTEHVMTTEDSEDSQLADQQKEKDVSSHSCQEQDIEGTCSSQSGPQFVHQDIQQSTEQLEGDLECFKMTEESGEVSQELTKGGEEIQVNQSDQELKDKPNQGVGEGNSPHNMVTVEDHMAHSEDYQEPRAAEVLEVRVESVEGTESKEGMSLYKFIV